MHIQRLGAYSSASGDWTRHRAVNPETNGGDFLKWTDYKFIQPTQLLVQSGLPTGCVIWCLGGRPTPQRVDLDFDAMTNATTENAITVQDLMRVNLGITALARTLPDQSAIWYYTGMVERSQIRIKDPDGVERVHKFYSGRQWDMMDDATRRRLVRQECLLYPTPDAKRIQYGMVLDSGANVPVGSCSHKVSDDIAAMGFARAGEPLASKDSWMLTVPSTAFCMSDTVSYVEAHNYDDSFNTMPPNKTSNVHTALLVGDVTEWDRNKEKLRGWWDMGCSIYIDSDTIHKRIKEILQVFHKATPIGKAPAAKAVK